MAQVQVEHTLRTHSRSLPAPRQLLLGEEPLPMAGFVDALRDDINACHSGIEADSALFASAPDLSAAGRAIFEEMLGTSERLKSLISALALVA